jgi:MarR family transcriptional regulator, lower aerobic nicotinate degradation pathway regulator
MTSKRKFAELDLLETPGHLLRRCQQRSQEIFKEVLGEFGLTQQQTALLLTLARSPTASIQDLSDASGTDRNTLSDITSRLIRRGLIVRRRSPRDARAYELRITANGVRLLGRMAPGMARVQQQILEPLKEREREAFIRMARSVACIGSADPSSN